MNRIASERKILGLSQEELAEELLVDKSTVVRWESGGTISDKKLIAMRELFGCDLDWLLGLSDQRKTIGASTWLV